MTTTEKELWYKIQNFQIDDSSSEFAFSDRLGRENGWSRDFCLRTIEEYKRFIFLICISDHPLTPSDQVDQVWHLHLLYTQSYWIELCRNTINRDIHHGPTRGGIREKRKFKNWYERTKELYKNTFDQITPDDIWPNSKKRFGEINFQRVSLLKNWIIPKPRFLKRSHLK